jgi:hypothetical protein
LTLYRGPHLVHRFSVWRHIFNQLRPGSLQLPWSAEIGYSCTAVDLIRCRVRHAIRVFQRQGMQRNREMG